MIANTATGADFFRILYTVNKSIRHKIEKTKHCTFNDKLLIMVFILTDVVILELLALITKRPQNVIVQQNENATLNCSTDTSSQGRNTITWYYDNDLIVHYQCRSTDHSAFIVTSPDLQTDCNVIARARGVGGISGPYRCSDGSSDPEAVAMIIVLSKLTFCSSTTMML